MALIASTSREHRRELLAALFRHYDRDVTFGKALVGLIPPAEEAGLVDIAPGSTWSHDELFQLAAEAGAGESSHPRLTGIQTFRTAVDALTVDYGLDRLGQDGRAQIVAWCHRYVRAAAAGSAAPSTYGPERLSTARTWFGFEPEVIGVIDPPSKRAEWAPMRESRRVARERLERQARDHIQRGLDQIEIELEGAGLVLPRVIPNLDRDIGWLYLKLRHRKSYQEILNDWRPPPEGGVETVRKAVLRAAARLAIDPTGWESGWR